MKTKFSRPNFFFWFKIPLFLDFKLTIIMVKKTTNKVHNIGQCRDSQITLNISRVCFHALVFCIMNLVIYCVILKPHFITQNKDNVDYG